MFSAFEKGQKHLFCPNVVSGDNIQTTFINLLRVANMSSFFVNKMRFVPVLSECCLQGRHLDNIHNICLCYFLQKHVFKKFKIGICLCIFKKVNLKSAASLNYVCFFPNLVFLCIGLSQCCLRNNIHTKDHECVLGGAKLISKNPQRKHFLG